MTAGKSLYGMPYAGIPHVRFDEREVESAAPRRGSLLCKVIRHIVLGRGWFTLLFALAMGFAARAEVVAWWRFDEIGADNKVVNAANPGTFDGYLTTGTSAVNGTWPAAEANMPLVTNSFRQVAPRVVDQLTGAVTNGGKALLWNGTAVKGGVLVPYGDAEELLLDMFTVEAFVRLPPEAAGRSNSMFPIVHFGNDNSSGWMFSIYHEANDGLGYLFFRHTYTNDTGSAKGTAWAQWKQCAARMPVLFDGRWHHVAASFNGNPSGNSATIILYVDGSPYSRLANTIWTGWDLVGNQHCPLQIGRNVYSDPRTYMGEIAEVRISDTVLRDNEFLLPLSGRPGLVDDDTALMLTFDTAKSMGYGFASQFLVPCAVNVTTTNYVWNARNWNIQNAAYATPLIPRWFSFSDVTGRDTYLGDELRPLQDETVLPGESLYGNALASMADAEGASLKICRNGGSWADLINVPGASALIADDLTMELFFKTDIANSDTDTLVFSSFLKWCIYQGNLLARTFTGSGHQYGGSSDEISSGKVNDGAWHHAAYVHDKANGAVSLYVDYKLVGTKAITPYVDAAATCLIGGQDRLSQVFAGNIDDVRITRRVLKPWEFLTTRAAASDRLMDAPLETDYSSGLDATLAPTGTVGMLAASSTSGDAALPAIVKKREGYVTLDGVAGETVRASGHAMRLDGGYVKWPYNRLLDRTDLTVEFFAKFDALNNSANLVRISRGTEVSGSPVWTLWYDGSREIRVTANITTNGGVSANSTNLILRTGAVADGKWHHWAMTVGPDASGSNTVFTLYRDYEVFGSSRTAMGKLRFPASGANLSIGGTAVSGAFIHGLVNNLRVSPGVLPTDGFMRFIPKAVGTYMILR